MRVKLILIGLFIFFFIPSMAMAEDACTHVDLDWISVQAPLPPDAKIVFKQEQSGLCEVVLSIEGRLAPIYTGKNFVLAGQMYKLGKALTQETMSSLSDVAQKEQEAAKEKEALAVEKRKAFFKTRIKSLEALVSMSFKPGNPKGSIYVITDPNCSHCKELLPKLEELAFEAKLALKMIIYPVLGTKSRDMAAHAICNDYSYEDYKEMTGENAMAICEKADELIKKTHDLFNSVQISFVPLVVASDGSWVVEGNDICEVRTHLGLETKEGEKGSGKGCASEVKD